MVQKRLDRYPLGGLLCTEFGSEKGAYNGRLDGYEIGKLERFLLGELLGADGEAEIGSSNGMSGVNK